MAQQTNQFLDGWQRIGIDWVDLAIRRPSGSWWALRDLSVHQVPLALARAANGHHADIYARPARSRPVPVLFLDDLPLTSACRLLATSTGIAVHTSIPGGCQVWIALTIPIPEPQRTCCQRRLAHQWQADPASISGDHYGRLPGFRNWKRDGYWVTIRATNYHSARFDPMRLIAADEPLPHPASPGRRTERVHGDHSASAKEWGWVCGAIEHGVPVDRIRQRLIQRARLRRGADAERYADLTLRRAMLNH